MYGEHLLKWFIAHDLVTHHLKVKCQARDLGDSVVCDGQSQPVVSHCVVSRYRERIYNYVNYLTKIDITFKMVLCKHPESKLSAVCKNPRH